MGSAIATRKLRADSVRNRERLLEAAAEIFSAGGAAATLEAVARRADVGIGTLYRHFPTREALFEAVYRREVDQLGELAERLVAEPDSVGALRAWLHANVRLVAAKRGMIEGLQIVAQASSELKTYSFERLSGAIRLLLDRAIAGDAIRADVTAEEFLRTMLGIFYSQSARNWQPAALRLVDVFVDGLRKR